MARPPRPRAGQLPAQVTPFVGRGVEIAAAAEGVLAGRVRLLTFTGPAGIGKTRLALQVAAGLQHGFAAGARFVDLAPISDTALVMPAIAQSLGLGETPGRGAFERVQDYLEARTLLLVLDNFEQVAGAASGVADLLAACPDLVVFVTSRSPLHVYGEFEFSVPPLELPDLHARVDAEALARTASVALFVQRAQAVRRDFAPTGESLRTVAEICVRLDGLPLAIELAAARSKLMAPAAMLARLERRLPLLTGGSHGMPVRHQTLWSAIDWSCGLLPDAERTVFRRLAVFAGGFSAASADAVAGRDGEDHDITEILVSLADKSLLSIVDQADGESRFGMLETIREYALDQLAANGELAETGRRHAMLYLALAERAALSGPQQAAWLAQLRREHDNLRAALRWSTEAGEVDTAARLAAALWWYWGRVGYLAEGRRSIEAVLALCAAPEYARERLLALNGAGSLAWYQGDNAVARTRLEEAVHIGRELNHRRALAQALVQLGLVTLRECDVEGARALMEEALALRRELDDEWGIAVALSCLAGVPLREGDYETARQMEEESAATFRALGDNWGLTLSLTGLGLIAAEQGDVLTARMRLEEALAIRRDLGDVWSLTQTLVSLGRLALREGDGRRAQALFEESLELRQRIGNRPAYAECLHGLGGVAVRAGRPADAATLFGAAGVVLHAESPPQPPGVRQFNAQLVQEARAAIGQSEFAAAWARGRTMSLEGAVEFARLRLGSAFVGSGGMDLSPPGPPETALTRREREVAVLIAHGKTNRQIAGELTITEGTVSTHVEHILDKLSFQSRAQVAVWVVEQGMLVRGRNGVRA